MRRAGSYTLHRGWLTARPGWKGPIRRGGIGLPYLLRIVLVRATIPYPRDPGEAVADHSAKSGSLSQGAGCAARHPHALGSAGTHTLNAALFLLTLILFR